MAYFVSESLAKPSVKTWVTAFHSALTIQVGHNQEKPNYDIVTRRFAHRFRNSLDNQWKHRRSQSLTAEHPQYHRSGGHRPGKNDSVSHKIPLENHQIIQLTSYESLIAVEASEKGIPSTRRSSQDIWAISLLFRNTKGQPSCIKFPRR